jgi:hypothetical protein
MRRVREDISLQDFDIVFVRLRDGNEHKLILEPLADLFQGT